VDLPLIFCFERDAWETDCIRERERERGDFEEGGTNYIM
jgi:hypothetical protein